MFAIPMIVFVTELKRVMHREVSNYVVLGDKMNFIIFLRLIN